jgi:hypothetical protein
MPTKDANGKQGEQDKELDGMAVEVSSNQVRDEPIPASHDEDKDQAGVVQNEEHWRRSADHDQASSRDNDQADRVTPGRTARD